MTQDEIIRMAREAGFNGHSPDHVFADVACLERFAALVAAHEREKPTTEALRQAYIAGMRAEREACAKVCEEGTALTAFQSKDCYSYAHNRAAAIRSRPNEH